MSNLQSMQAAVKAAARPETPAPQPKPATENPHYRPSRVEKLHIGVWLSPPFKSSVRLIQAKTNKTLVALVVEALNDLFRKYNVPTCEEKLGR